MEHSSYRQGSESLDSDEPAPPGTGGFYEKSVNSPSTSSPVPQVSSKGVENAKKRLRAFSIQKKAPLTPVPQVKPLCTGNTTVLIGRLSAVKTTPKPDKVEDDQKKLPKPPKPGGSKKPTNEPYTSYTELQKKTLSEIEDMKRKMELVELGIPLGLICPSTNALPVKAMPTKAMPPIKTFLDSAKVDEIIREAKKAKAEGREFKFDYQKFVPDYDNPFQRKKDHPEHGQDAKETPERKEEEFRKSRSDRDKDRKSDRYDKKIEYKREDRYKSRDKFDVRKEESRSRDREDKRDREDRSKDRSDRNRDRIDRNKEDRSKDRDKIREKDEKRKKDDLEEIRKEKLGDEMKEPGQCSKNLQEKDIGEVKEADVNLNDFLVCDSWSLDTEDKHTNSPQVEKVRKPLRLSQVEPLDQLRQSLGRNMKSVPKIEIPLPKMEKLKPVIDCFKFEIDPNDDEVIDIFDENSALDKYSTKTKSRRESRMKYDNDKDTLASGDVNDDTFLESVINEIKLENMSEEDNNDKSLVEYDESPTKDSIEPSIRSVTPELDDRSGAHSRKSDYSDGHRSIDSRKSSESGYKSSESGFKSIEGYKVLDTTYTSGSSDKSYRDADNSSDSYKDAEFTDRSSKSKSGNVRLSVEKELDVDEAKMSRDTIDSLETWSFVLKICQPLLFRHDKSSCYKSTRSNPKLWFAQNPKLCNCVKDRSIVYEELEMCKTGLVDRLYGCDQISDTLALVTRTWYPRADLCVVEHPIPTVDMATEWDIEDPPKQTRPPMTPQKNDDVSLDREYQRFMEAVSWTDREVSESKQGSGSTTPVRQESRKKKIEDKEDKKRAKKMKLSGDTDGWSQESEVEEEVKPAKVKRKRKHSTSTLTSESEQDGKKRKKSAKKKGHKKTKNKSLKRRRTEKKMLKKHKKKRKKETAEESEFEEKEEVVKKKEKQVKKKKLKRKAEKKRKRLESTSSSSSTSSSDSNSESDSESDKKAKKKKKKKEAEARKKKKEKKKKRKHSTSESTQSEELFDVNILNNIKQERAGSPPVPPGPPAPPRPPAPPTPVKSREIIDVKELHHEFSHQVHIKLEAEEEAKKQERQDREEKQQEDEEKQESDQQETVVQEKIEVSEPIAQAPESKPVLVDTEADLMNNFELGEHQYSEVKDKVEFKEPEIPTPPPRPDETSQCSSQESNTSLKESEPVYEKDESHLRPSSQNSNYSFNDVMQSQCQYKAMEDVHTDSYENYEMYEQLAMAYQSDVASQPAAAAGAAAAAPWRRIETVVRSREAARGRGEIKCDWKAGSAAPAPAPARRSRWGLKPGEVNIVLTGGGSPGDRAGGPPPPPAQPAPPAPPAPQLIYRIQSLANRSDNSVGYDEAYMDMYGAADRLQYGDCFAEPPAPAPAPALTPAAARPAARSLDDRIHQALRDTVLGEVVTDENADKNTPEKGILVMKSLSESRGGKRVSFADGYKPGQDSDVEEPPVKKRGSRWRVGCAWPCSAEHPDHVPLWDALPPPPPPPGSPPPPRSPPAAPPPAPPPLHLLRRAAKHPLLPTPPHPLHKFDPNSTMANFMPPEPPPGIISFQ